MTQEEFIEVLDDNGYSYKMEGNNIVVTHNRSVYLESLETLPPGVEFKNRGSVYLGSLETLSPGVEFSNNGDVFLRALQTLSPGVEFNNGGNVYLESLKILPPGVVFRNVGYIYLGSLNGGDFKDWGGNIEGISPNRLLNKMIEIGLLDRR